MGKDKRPVYSKAQENTNSNTELAAADNLNNIVCVNWNDHFVCQIATLHVSMFLWMHEPFATSTCIFVPTYIKKIN